MDAVDTNVLVYAHDTRDPTKQAIAISTIESIDEGVLVWQVACEYLAASRKLAPLGYNQSDAWRDVRDLMNIWSTLLPSMAVLDAAEGLLAQYSLAFWDAMIIGACVEGNIARLYSEDFSGYSQIEGLDVVNPFKS